MDIEIAIKEEIRKIEKEISELDKKIEYLYLELSELLKERKKKMGELSVLKSGFEKEKKEHQTSLLFVKRRRV